MRSFAFLIPMLYAFAGFAQGKLYPCKFMIVDARTHKPIEKAMVTVEQAGHKTVLSEYMGISDFGAIPEGRIDVKVSHKEYRHRDVQHTISSEPKNNAFTIELLPNSESNLLVSGKVEDAEGAELVKVNVEVWVNGRPYRTQTDGWGNYLLDISLQNVRSDRVQMEFRMGKCKLSQEVTIPESRAITKNITFNCAGNGDGGGSGGSENKPVNMTGVWEMMIRSEYVIRAGVTTRSGSKVGSMLNLKQNGDRITGTYGGYNTNFKTGEVYGKLTSDGVQLKITCTEGWCQGGGMVLTGVRVNNSMNWKIKPIGSEPARCLLYIGAVTMTKKDE